MFKLVLCHRIKEGISKREFHDHWRQARSALVVDLQPALGFSSYGQTHQSSRLNPVYLSMLFSRSRLVASLLGARRFSRTQPIGSDERWDVTDEFDCPSRDAFVQAIMSEAGTSAARRLTEDQGRLARCTAVVTSEKFVAAPDPAARPADVRTEYFLRRRPVLTRDKMLSYWGDSHKRLVLSLQGALKYRAYHQLHVRNTTDLTDVVQRLGGSAVEEFDGVAELCFTSQWDLIKGIFNPRTQLANFQLVKDETGFVDHQRSVLVYGNHYRLFVA